MSVPPPLIVGVILAGLLVTGYLFLLRFVHRYEIKDNALKIMFLGSVPVRTVPLDDITGVEVISWTRTLPFAARFEPGFLVAERWPSYVFSKKGVLIRKRRGISRLLILSPRDPEAFAERILNARQRAS